MAIRGALSGLHFIASWTLYDWGLTDGILVMTTL